MKKVTWQEFNEKIRFDLKIKAVKIVREIKFRGISERTGKMIYGDLISSPNGLEKYIIQKVSENKYFLKNLNPETINAETAGQCTGLKDKNGKEIYEGDVVIVAELTKAVKGKVIYEGSAFIVKVIGSHNVNLYREINCEIIGNVWENAELLTPEVKGGERR